MSPKLLPYLIRNCSAGCPGHALSVWGSGVFVPVDQTFMSCRFSFLAANTAHSGFKAAVFYHLHCLAGLISSAAISLGILLLTYWPGRTCWLNFLVVTSVILITRAKWRRRYLLWLGWKVGQIQVAALKTRYHSRLAQSDPSSLLSNWMGG